MEDLSNYQAAAGNFQVLVDTEKDAKFLPSVIRGERTTYSAAGSVDASVDFSNLDAQSIVVSEDRRSVTISPARADAGRAHTSTWRTAR